MCALVGTTTRQATAPQADSDVEMVKDLMALARVVFREAKAGDEPVRPSEIIKQAQKEGMRA